MWIMVVWFFLVPSDVRAMSSVHGFATKEACEAAGPIVAKAMLNSLPQSSKARLSFVCVGNGQ